MRKVIMKEITCRIALTADAQETVDYLFREYPNVTTTTDDIFSLAADALLVPLNAFGFFSSGFPLAVTDRFGLGLQDTLQSRIMENYFGEMLVGQAEILSTGQSEPAWVVAAPLARTLQDDLTDSLNVYQMVRGALLAMTQPDAPDIKTLAMLLPGVSPGGLTPYTAARQIRFALQSTLREKPRKFENLSKAKRREDNLKRKEKKTS